LEISAIVAGFVEKDPLGPHTASLHTRVAPLVNCPFALTNVYNSSECATGITIESDNTISEIRTKRFKFMN
jgi:hypothetical protein